MWREIFITVLQKIPWENLLVRRRSETERLEQLATLLNSVPKAEVRSPTAPQETAKTEPQGLPGASERPTTEQTIRQLRRRLGKELYKAELDLAAGLRFDSLPCDCLDQKHSLMLEAAAEEMMSYEQNPVYGQIIDWLRLHQNEFPPEEIAKRSPEHYQAMAPEIRNFRKRVMGSEALSAMRSPAVPITLEEAKAVAARVAAERVEKQWQSIKKT